MNNYITKLYNKYSKYDYLNVSNEYICACPEIFDNQHGGICFDYTRRIHEDLIKDNITNYKHFFFANISDDGIITSSHTFTLFYDDTVHYLECAWKDNIGIFEFKTEDEALSYIQDKLKNQDDYIVVNYDPIKDVPDWNYTLTDFCITIIKYNDYSYNYISNSQPINKLQ